MTKLSDEHKEKIRRSMLGKKNALGTHHLVSDNFREYRRNAWLGNTIWCGRHHSEDSRKKIAAGNKISQVGRKITPEQRRVWSNVKKGDKHWNWRGGISALDKRIRQSLEYRLWREAVFKRDNYTCIWCGERGVYLEADHIKPFAFFPELRFIIDNGRSLCKPCHAKTDTYKGKTKWRTV